MRPRIVLTKLATLCALRDTRAPSTTLVFAYHTVVSQSACWQVHDGGSCTQRLQRSCADVVVGDNGLVLPSPPGLHVAWGRLQTAKQGSLVSAKLLPPCMIVCHRMPFRFRCCPRKHHTDVPSIIRCRAPLHKMHVLSCVVIRCKTTCDQATSGTNRRRIGDSLGAPPLAWHQQGNMQLFVC